MAIQTLNCEPEFQSSIFEIRSAPPSPSPPTHPPLTHLQSCPLFPFFVFLMFFLLTFWCFLLFLFQRRGSVSTHDQCWNVSDWETTERDQPSEAQPYPPTSTQRKSEKPTFRLWPKRLRKEVHILFSTFQLFTQTKWHKRRDPTPRSRGTMLKVYQNYRGTRPPNSTQKDM